MMIVLRVDVGTHVWAEEWAKEFCRGRPYVKLLPHGSGAFLGFAHLGVEDFHVPGLVEVIRANADVRDVQLLGHADPEPPEPASGMAVLGPEPALSPLQRALAPQLQQLTYPCVLVVYGPSCATPAGRHGEAFALETVADAAAAQALIDRAGYKGWPEDLRLYALAQTLTALKELTHE